MRTGRKQALTYFHWLSNWVLTFHLTYNRSLNQLTYITYINLFNTRCLHNEMAGRRFRTTAQTLRVGNVQMSRAIWHNELSLLVVLITNNASTIQINCTRNERSTNGFHVNKINHATSSTRSFIKKLISRKWISATELPRWRGGAPSPTQPSSSTLAHPNCFTPICITVILQLYAHCKRPCDPYVANKCMYPHFQNPDTPCVS